ncbi:hypothetical protein OU415_15770 [Saccharopolyspora sp. WRP15-2]|uniref:Uncharacterized protein n=1 Tax=Saccharopolyspora oryzae TaxID=2997343 RepID=A0ABT4UYW6_9PSEU|nr:hypothetical protein [Saccharopolyspora oryzae]MDA3626903.1 hypothetical protein [Saccharopolyspora oryzae]
MTQVWLAGNNYDVVSASDVAADAETLEFRKADDVSRVLEIAITQVGDYGSPDLRIIVFRELSLAVVEDAVYYARKRFGVPSGMNSG